MTRFLITLEEAIDFVINALKIMKGGEIIIPKLPSIKITELAKIMAPSLKQKIIGVRPGEKLHEVMCPKDDSHLVIEFKKYYIICPTIEFNKKKNFIFNFYGEKGKRVKQYFEYNSKDNKTKLSKKKLLKLIKNI